MSGMAVLLADGHEDPGHQREVERHVAFVAVAEVRTNVGRPLVGLAEQHGVRKRCVELRRICFRTACVSGRFSLLVPSRTHKYGTASSRSASTPELEPEGHDSMTASTTSGLL